MLNRLESHLYSCWSSHNLIVSGQFFDKFSILTWKYNRHDWYVIFKFIFAKKMPTIFVRIRQ